jgi:hypothetical protein
MNRVRFITHLGRRVLLMDLTNSSPEEILDTLDEVENVVAEQPPDSLLTLSDFTGAAFSKQAADRMKIVAAKNRSHVHRAAIVGLDSIPEVYYQNLLSFSARKFPAFKTREEALDWLLEDRQGREKEAAAS